MPWLRLLYGPLVDYVLSYHDATVIREGPPLDPKALEQQHIDALAQGKYLFAMYPHGQDLFRLTYLVYMRCLWRVPRLLRWCGLLADTLSRRHNRPNLPFTLGISARHGPGQLMYSLFGVATSRLARVSLLCNTIDIVYIAVYCNLEPSFRYMVQHVSI